MASIKGLHLNTDYKAETISSSSPLCCDDAPRKGERVLPSHGTAESHSVSEKKTASCSSGNKSITIVCFHLHDKSLEKTFTLSMIFFKRLIINRKLHIPRLNISTDRSWACCIVRFLMDFQPIWYCPEYWTKWAINLIQYSNS